MNLWIRERPERGLVGEGDDAGLAEDYPCKSSRQCHALTSLNQRSLPPFPGLA